MSTVTVGLYEVKKFADMVTQYGLPQNPSGEYYADVLNNDGTPVIA